ncbi:hypothetical protein [Brevundimonas sp.]|uniref:hypothetical protein n=1 Tax=Brevundimonas sp. TaxID=1871086 RepID=UPI002FC8B5ED
MRKTLLAVTAALMLSAAPAPVAVMAQDDDIVQRIINSPPVDSWQVLGVSRAPRPQRAEGVLGERAIRVAAQRAEQPWTMAAQMPIRGEIKRGDTILLAVWARLETPPEGRQTSRLPLRVQQAAAPYAAIAQDTGEVGPEWKMIYASGVAQQDFAGGQTNLSVHLATDNQTVDLGPALVLNFGQDYDAAKLPRNEP